MVAGGGTRRPAQEGTATRCLDHLGLGLGDPSDPRRGSQGLRQGAKREVEGKGSDVATGNHTHLVFP